MAFSGKVMFVKTPDLKTLGWYLSQPTLSHLDSEPLCGCHSRRTLGVACVQVPETHENKLVGRQVSASCAASLTAEWPSEPWSA